MELSLHMTTDKERIKEEIAALRAKIAERQSEIKILSYGITHYQKQCDHAGQETGYNERDGDWGNPCPTCGYAY